MSNGARVTDEVEFWKRRGDLRRVVRVVRNRTPERLRWRLALSRVTGLAKGLGGLERLRLVEPVRETVLDLDDRMLRRETVLDARLHGVDLDRGEVLPARTRWDLKRASFLTGVDHEVVGRYVRMPVDFSRPIDTAGVSLVARALAGSHQRRADKLATQLERKTDPSLERYERVVRQRVDHDRDLARRWAALSRAILQGSR